MDDRAQEFAWLVQHADDDEEYWLEADEIERWLEDGAPSVSEWRQGVVSVPSLPEQPQPTEVPAIALAVGRKQAAALLNVSVDHFERHILHELRVVTSGRRTLVPVRELERWLEDNSARALRR